MIFCNQLITIKFYGLLFFDHSCIQIVATCFDKLQWEKDSLRVTLFLNLQNDD